MAGFLNTLRSEVPAVLGGKLLLL